MSKLRFFHQHFSTLNALELYDLLKLRSLVFVVEQNCVFLDMDDKDQKSIHVLGYDDAELVACSRIVPPGISYNEVSIGRVASHPEHRNKGLGKKLMQETLAVLEETFGPVPVRIGAQLYLQRFYEDFGFVRVGDEYDEDGIPHIIMLKKAYS